MLLVPFTHLVVLLVHSTRTALSLRAVRVHVRCKTLNASVGRRTGHVAARL
jgi:hypothetical protein